MPYLGNEPAVAYTSTTKDTFSGDASTTDFTMSKSANVNAVRVVVENVVQNPTVAYTCSGTTLSFTSAPPTGTNNIYVVHLGPPAATVAPPTLINNPTTFTGGVTLKNETAEDTDGGRESIVTFQGTQSGSEISTLAQIESAHDGTSDDQKGDLIFKTNDGSDGASPTEAMRIDSSQNVGIGTTDTNGGRLVVGSAVSGDTSLIQLLRTGVTERTNFIGLSDSDALVISADENDEGADSNIKIKVDGTEAMRIDSSGNLNIGSTTNVGYGPLQIGSTSTSPTILQMIGSTSSNNAIHFGDGTSGDDRYRGFVQYGHADNALLFGTNASEQMRIDSNGNKIMRNSAIPASNIDSGASTGSYFTSAGQFHSSRATNSSSIHIEFMNSNGLVGSISTASSSTSYNTSSDYRLKENVVYDWDATTRLKQLKPARFNFIADPDTTVDGFLAHEAQTVIPEAVTGEKDAVKVWNEADDLPKDNDGKPTVSVGDNKLDADGNTIPEYQGIDQSKLVPLLVKTIQELEARITALEAE